MGPPKKEKRFPAMKRYLRRCCAAVSPWRNRSAIKMQQRGQRSSFIRRGLGFALVPLILVLLTVEALLEIYQVQQSYETWPVLPIIICLCPPLCNLLAPCIGVVWVVFDRVTNAMDSSDDSLRRHIPAMVVEGIPCGLGRLFIAFMVTTLVPSTIGFAAQIFSSGSLSYTLVLLCEYILFCCLKFGIIWLANVRIGFSELQNLQDMFEGAASQEDFVNHVLEDSQRTGPWKGYDSESDVEVTRDNDAPEFDEDFHIHYDEEDNRSHHEEETDRHWTTFQ